MIKFLWGAGRGWPKGDVRALSLKRGEGLRREEAAREGIWGLWRKDGAPREKADQCVRENGRPSPVVLCFGCPWE